MNGDCMPAETHVSAVQPLNFHPGGPLTSYFFNHPDHIKHILQDNNHNYSKQHRVTDLLKPFVGDGLLTSDGEVWRR